ncbi:DUF5050 domain-containing protein [Candidatus Latescibacterota bacterium]
MARCMHIGISILLSLFILFSVSCDKDSPTSPSDDNTLRDLLSPYKIAYYSSRNGKSDIYVMNADGSNRVNITNNPYYDFEPSWSPDGSKIAFSSSRDGNTEIYVMNADGSEQTNITNDPHSDLEPSWSPDGTQIAFRSQRYRWNKSATPRPDIYIMNTDGTNQKRITSDYFNFYFEPSWSPDGSLIAYATTKTSASNIYVMDTNGAKHTNLTNYPARDFYPVWSPDGSKIAFLSERDGNTEIYVMNADGSNQTNNTNHPSLDYWPSWSPDGLYIAFSSFRDGNYDIYVMDADGSNQINITNSEADESWPSWSPIIETDR